MEKIKSSGLLINHNFINNPVHYTIISPYSFVLKEKCIVINNEEINLLKLLGSNVLNTVKLFNCDVACLNLNETLRQIEEIIDTKSYTQHVVINAGKVVLMQDNERLRELLKVVILSMQMDNQLFGQQNY